MEARNVFRWLILLLGLGYLAVFYQFVQAYVESIKNNRFEYHTPFVFDTKTGATYVYEDPNVYPQRSVIFSYPIDHTQLPKIPIEEDPLGLFDNKKILYDEASKHFDLGTYKEYLEKIQSPERRKLLYDNISTKVDVGTYEEFEARLGFKDSK